MVDWDSLDLSNAPEGYRELRTGVVEVVLSGMNYFHLTGDDALSWLQGQATNDVGLLQSQPWLDFCLTKPTGQMLAMCRAWQNDKGVIISTQQPEVLLEKVETTVFLEDVEIKPLEEKVTCLQGPKVMSVGLPSDRTGSGGVEVIGGQHSFNKLSEEGFLVATLEAGIPLFDKDTSAKTLQPELGGNFDSTFTSYNKGCYTGQEVLMRIKSRGHTNKSWVGLKLSGKPEEDDVTLDDKKMGKIHRRENSPVFGLIASGTVRNLVAEPGTVLKCGDIEATVCKMPFLN